MEATGVIGQAQAASRHPVAVLPFLRAYPFRTLAAAATGFGVGILGWGTALFVQHVVDHTHDLRTLHLLALGLAFVLVLRGAVSLVRRSLQVHLARRIESELADRYIDHVARLEMRFYEKYHTSDLLNRLRGLEVLRNAFEDRLLGVTFDAMLVLVAAGVMAHQSLTLAIIAMTGAALPGVIIAVARGSIQKSFEQIRQGDGNLSHACLDALAGVRDLRLTEGEDWVVRKVKEAYRKFQDSRIGHIMKLTAIGALIILVSSLTGIAVLVAGAGLVNRSEITQGQLMFLFTMAGTMLGPLEQLASTWISYDEASVAMARYHEILLLPAEPREPSPPDPSVEGTVTLEKVDFSYRQGRPVLKEVDLHVEAGRSVAIVGESGAGKSTLLALLAGLYTPDRGRVLLDGRDLQELGLQKIRQSIGAVFQHPHLMDATVEENIRVGRWEATSEEVREAARLAHAHEFIERLPDGYASRVRRSGGTFSGGQVQRIALARALVGRPRILLLDEATGNLDAHTEAAIWTALTECSGRCTRLVITHRLATAARTDRTVVLHKGLIAEAGTFDELVRSEGVFYRLWKRQNGIPTRP